MVWAEGMRLAGICLIGARNARRDTWFNLRYDGCYELDGFICEDE